MKLVMAALAFSLSLTALAQTASDESGTEADAAAVKACFGGCENNDNQTNINYSPYEVEKQYNEIMHDRAVVDPTKKDPGAKRESWDI